MWTLIREGGWSMFVILALGAAALLTAASQAARPESTREGFIQWISGALLCATLGGVASDLAAVGHALGGDEEKLAAALGAANGALDATTRTRMLLQGFAESMSPAILGFAFLTLVALLTAVGRRRMDASRS